MPGKSDPYASKRYVEPLHAARNVPRNELIDVSRWLTQLNGRLTTSLKRHRKIEPPVAEGRNLHEIAPVIATSLRDTALMIWARHSVDPVLCFRQWYKSSTSNHARVATGWIKPSELELARHSKWNNVQTAILSAEREMRRDFYTDDREGRIGRVCESLTELAAWLDSPEMLEKPHQYFLNVAPLVLAQGVTISTILGMPLPYQEVRDTPIDWQVVPFESRTVREFKRRGLDNAAASLRELTLAGLA